MSVGITRRAVGYRFSLTVEGSDALAAYSTRLFSGFAAVDAAPDDVRWLVRPGAVEDRDRFEFSIDGEPRTTAQHAEGLVGAMVQTLNTEVVRSWAGPVCHAGGVAHDGCGILLPADPESGKTTLTTGLVRAGFSYLTDEGVAFHPGTTRIEPYPKPLSLDPGSWFLFPELEPQADFATDEYKRDQWQVAPTDIRADAVGRPCEARYVVFPRYLDGATTELGPIGRAAALLELAKNTFEFNTRSRAALEELEPVIRRCDCFRLTVGRLDDAVACIQELVGDA